MTLTAHSLRRRPRSATAKGVTVALRSEVHACPGAQERLRWPDGFSFGPGGYLYVTTSALHLKWGREDMARHAPYYIMRMRIEGAATASGH